MTQLAAILVHAAFEDTTTMVRRCLPIVNRLSSAAPDILAADNSSARPADNFRSRAAYVTFNGAPDASGAVGCQYV